MRHLWTFLTPTQPLVLGLALLLCLVAGGAPAQPASAAAVVVTTTADSGAGSLREAILTANATPGLDTISFAIPGSGVQTIQPLSPLPTVTDPVVIDGSTQPGYSSIPLIEISGDLAITEPMGPLINGLTVSAGGSTVQALTINRFTGAGLVIGGSEGSIVEGCFIGTTSDGTGGAGNNDGGVYIRQSPNNRIGGTTLATRNVIAGNSRADVYVWGGNGVQASGNVIQGNYIGIDRHGQAAVPSSFASVFIEGAPDAIIGGTAPGARNVIAVNHSIGIVVINADRATIQGNYVGIGADGVTSVSREGTAIFIEASESVLVGGTPLGARNIVGGRVYGNTGSIGIAVTHGSTVRIEGNHIGLAADGRTLVPHTNGILVSWGGSKVTVGGTVPGAGNLIAGSLHSHVGLHALLPPDTEPSTLTIQGNRIGLDIDGVPVPGHTVEAIYIGRGRDVEIGGTSTSASNTIFGGDSSIKVGHGRGTRILGNSIYGHTAQSIDLVQMPPGELTPNDPGDGDDGPNDLQNFPVVTSVGTRGSAATVVGKLDSRPAITYRVELFAGMGNPPQGRGELRRFLGATDVTTDATGSGAFALTLGALAPDEWVSATATGQTSGTSEASPAVASTAANVLVSPTAGLHTTEAGGTATFTVGLATAPAKTVVVPLTSTDPSEGAVSLASLTFTPTDALTPRTVTVRGIDDASVDGPKAYSVQVGPLQTDDPTYAGIDPPDVALTNADNDVLGACSPRPPVNVSTARTGPGLLQVTVRATSNALTPDNRLSELRFRAPAGVQIDVAGVAGRTGTFTAPLPDRPVTTTFVVRNASPGPTTVPFDVIDGCPPWSTFVGDGGR